MTRVGQLAELRQQEYRQQLVVNRYRRDVFETKQGASQASLEALHAAEIELDAIQQQRAKLQRRDPTSNGQILNTFEEKTLGNRSTGLDAQVHLRMEQVPTALAHLLDPSLHPLVSCRVKDTRNENIRRVRLRSFIEGYSAEAVDTFELDPGGDHKFDQLPTLFPERIASINELTRATVNVLLEDLDGKTELHTTAAVWLLARTSAPLAITDPQTGGTLDMTPYLGAFVTPNAPGVMRFVRLAALHHPQGKLEGYLGGEAAVEGQAKAIFDALKSEATIAYVHSVIQFSPEQGSINQRVRRPQESLEDRQANCIDGTVLFASLLEAVSLSPAIVIVPGHALVAWETRFGEGEWQYLETTMIGAGSFEEARADGEAKARSWKEKAEQTQNPRYFRIWPLRVLRSKHRITPME